MKVLGVNRWQLVKNAFASFEGGVINFFLYTKGRTTERPHSLEGEFLARYTFALQFTKDKNVLDIGAGLGAGTNYVALNGAKRVLGIDYSKVAITYAKKNFSLPNLEFKIMNAINVLLRSKSFDVCLAFEVIEHLSTKHHAIFLNSIVQVLRAKGVCLISTPNKLITSPGRFQPYNPYHIKEFEPEEFTNLLQRHFSIVLLMGVKCINEGYLEQQKEIKRTLRHRLASFLGQYRIVRELLAYMPKEFKQKITSEDRLPRLEASDFEICVDNIENCEGLLAVCKKGKT